MSILSDSYTAVKYYEYNEYGKQTTLGNSSFINDMTYTGAVTEGGNVFYMNARFYDANNGRFLTQDTYKGNMWEPNSQNLYTYVGNNPTNYVDPTGHRRVKDTEVSDDDINNIIEGDPLWRWACVQDVIRHDKERYELVYGDDAELYLDLIDRYEKRMDELEIHEDKIDYWIEIHDEIDIKLDKAVDRFYDRNGADVFIDYGTIALFYLGGYANPESWPDTLIAFQNSGVTGTYYMMDLAGTKLIIAYETLEAIPDLVSGIILEQRINFLQNKYYYSHYEEVGND